MCTYIPQLSACARARMTDGEPVPKNSPSRSHGPVREHFPFHVQRSAAQRTHLFEEKSPPRLIRPSRRDRRSNFARALRRACVNTHTHTRVVPMNVNHFCVCCPVRAPVRVAIFSARKYPRRSTPVHLRSVRTVKMRIYAMTEKIESEVISPCSRCELFRSALAGASFTLCVMHMFCDELARTSRTRALGRSANLDN